ncbi:MAG: DnaJ domain, partial [Gaiellaceae bacterium]|nr:DnaJ domain [Gaiellaceae bacterium]
PDGAMTDRKLTVAQAARILNVAEDASREEVRASFRRVIGASHPDRGGDEDLARLAVGARDVLLDSALRDESTVQARAKRERTFVRRRRFAWR